MKYSKLALLISLLAIIVVTGCSRSVMDIDGSAMGSSTVNPKNSPVDIKVLDTRSKFINGLLMVNADIENGTSNQYTIEYKFSWFDSNGMTVDDGGNAWNPIYMQGKETRTIQGLAPNPSVKAFKIRIREADDSDAIFNWRFKPLFN